MTGLLLVGAAVALGAAFGAMAWLGDLFVGVRTFVVLFGLASGAYAVAVLRVVRRPPAGAGALTGILLAGFAFRLVLLPTVPSLSTDLYRYLWDGRLAAAGVSPYAYPPSAPELAAFRDAHVYPRLNHVDWRTIYPPGAQLVFAGMARLAPGSVLGFKLLVIALDLAACGLLVGWLAALGRPPAWVLLYAWHPLVVVELAGSGHLDAIVLAATVGALWAAGRGREGWAGALLGGGVLVKLYPALLLPAIWGRRPGRSTAACLAVVAAGYALFAPEGAGVLGSLPRYVAEEEFNGGLRALLDLALTPLGAGGALLARLLPLVGLAGFTAGLAVWGRTWPAWRRALWLVGAYLLATPNLFPWYALWLVPVLAAAPRWPWLHLTLAVALSYLAFADPAWRIPAWVVAVEFGPVVLGLLLLGRRPAAAGANRAASSPRSAEAHP